MTDQPETKAGAHPAEAVCGKIYEAHKSGDHLKTLQYYDELLSLAQEGLPADEALLENVRTSWARAMIASQAHLQDEEHTQELLSDYEDMLNEGMPCSYLRGVLMTGDSPATAVQKYNESGLGPLDSDAVRGCVEHFKSASRTDITELIAVLEVLGVPMAADLSEKLQNYYVIRMKDPKEDPEVVLEEMKVDGLIPTTARPYNMIFVRPTSKKPFMQHYEDMLELGIKPEQSSLRLLLKKDLPKEDLNALRMTQKLQNGGSKVPTDFQERLSELCGLRTVNHDCDQALKLFMQARSEIKLHHRSYNTMIEGLRNEPEKAEDVYQMMIADGVKPTTSTFAKLIRIWHQNRLTDIDKWVYEPQKQNVEIDTVSLATVLDAYVRNNQRGRALQLLVSMLSTQAQSNNQNVYNIIMKFGPFDFAVGILACLISEGLPVSASAKSTLTNLARDPLSQQFVDYLNDAQWDARSILLSDAIMITLPDLHPSLVDCMKLLMREIKLGAEATEKRLAMLQAQVALVSES